MNSRLYISKLIKFFLFKLFKKNNLIKKVNNQKIIFSVNNSITFDRALYYYEKETLEWINDFKDGEVFWDVGSCVGVYSLYAALSKKCKVFAFEPFIPNFNLAQKNFALNDVEDKCNIFNFFISNTSQIDDMFISKNYVGASQQLNKKLNEVLTKKIMKVSIDDLVEKFNFEVPNHIKIDVERSEKELIDGFKKTLGNKKLKTVAIECHESNFDFIRLKLSKNNFILKKKVKQSDLDTMNYFYKL